jgi:diguanylate cyclase (GGDEF)-like protein/PAS domain S-box-containing protein
MDTAPDLGTNTDEKFWLTFEQAGVGMSLISPKGYYLRANPEFCRMLGYTEAQLRGLTFNDITHPEDAAADNELSNRLLTGEIATYRTEKRYRRRDGRIMWGGLSVSLVRDEVGAPIHFITIVQDITERKQVREELEQARNRYQAIYDSIDDFISINGLRGNFVFASASSVNVLGYAPEELVGTNVFRYVHPNDYDIVYEAYRKFNEGSNEHLRVRYRAFRKDGVYAWIETHARPFSGIDDHEREIVCVSRDVPDQQLTQETLILDLDRQTGEIEGRKTEELAHRDGVAGILNRPEVDELLGSMLVSPRSANFPFGVLLVDMDNFKAVNDTYGQAIGNQILRKVSVVLQEGCRSEDVVGRYGGDEFLIVLPGTNPSGTITLGEKLISNVRSIDWSDMALRDDVTISIGATCVAYGSERTLPELMGVIEQQLYQAKDAGRDRLVMNTRQTSQKLVRG